MAINEILDDGFRRVEETSDNVREERGQTMRVTTYEGVVENGRVQLPAGVSLPEKARVFVVVPDVVEIEAPRTGRVSSPRLSHPEQAKDFVKEVVGTKEKPNAGL